MRGIEETEIKNTIFTGCRTAPWLEDLDEVEIKHDSVSGGEQRMQLPVLARKMILKARMRYIGQGNMIYITLLIRFWA